MRTVIFLDLDGTMMRNPFHTAVFPAVTAQLSAKTGQQPGDIGRMLSDENAARRARPAVAPALAWDWDDIVQTVAGRLGTVFDGDVAEIVAAHAAPPFSAALDDAPDVLRRLAAPHRALVAATHGLSKYQLPVLEALGLWPWLTGLLAPDVTGAAKQARSFFGRWPDGADLCLMAGDLYDDDVAPAHGFGFRTVLKAPVPGLDALDPFDRPALYPFAAGQAVRPDAIIASLAELPAVVDRLEGAVYER